MLAGLLGASGARAGSYVIGDCPAAFNHTGSAGPWQYVGPTGGSEIKIDCSAGSGDWLGFSADLLQPERTGFRVSTNGTDLTIMRARVWWRAYGSYYAGPERNQSHSGGAIIDGQGNGASQFTTNNNWDTSANPVTVDFPASDNATEVTLGQICNPWNNMFFCPMDGNGGPTYQGKPVVVQILGVELTLLDNVAPTAGLTGGTLDGPGPVSGSASLDFTASDPDSGIKKAGLLVDGTTVVTHDYSSSCTYTQLQACPGSEADELVWDSSAVSPGVHQVALRVIDAAGNSTLSSPHEVVVASSQTTAAGGAITGASPGTGLSGLSPSPIAHVANGTPCAGPVLSLTINGKSRPAPVHFGNTTTIRGWLHCGTSPIRGATVAIGTSDATLGATDTRGSLPTGPDGSFIYHLTPGPSRVLTFSYTAYSDDTQPAASATANIYVLPSITLKITPQRTRNNRTILWRGRIAGGPYPHDGVTLLVQVRQGGRWQTFDQIITHNGRFAYRYTFRRTTQPTVYTFRIALPHGGSVGYPYSAAGSRPINVLVS